MRSVHSVTIAFAALFMTLASGSVFGQDDAYIEGVMFRVATLLSQNDLTNDERAYFEFFLGDKIQYRYDDYDQLKGETVPTVLVAENKLMPSSYRMIVVESLNQLAAIRALQAKKAARGPFKDRDEEKAFFLSERDGKKK